MKKRILSFLLVLCTLLTMIPVMTQAAETEEAASTEATNADYAKLYERTGLVHAYMAFGTSDASYDIAGGVWYDLVGSANATIAGGAYSDSNPTGWKAGVKGGLTYEDTAFTATANVIKWTVGSEAGQLDLPDTYTVEFLNRSDLREIPVGWKNSTVTSAAVPDSTDTLYTLSFNSWSAAFGKIMITFKGTAKTAYTVKINGKDTTVTMDATGAYTYAGSVPTKVASYTVQVPNGCTVDKAQYSVNDGGLESKQAFAFGHIRSMVWTNKLAANAYGNGYGSMRWYASQYSWGSKNGNGQKIMVSEDRTFVNYDGQTLAYTIVKEKYTVDTGDTMGFTVSYGRGGGYGKASYSYVPANGTPASSNDYGAAVLLPDSDYVFQVQENLPGAVYSLRMYDCKISAETQKLNHFVDIMAYTRFDIDTYKALTADEKTALHNHYAEVDLETVSAGEIADVIARIKGEKDSTKTLYVQNGLVGLYLAPSADLATGVWYNSVENGANATMEGRWYRNEDGTLHVNGDVGQTIMPNGKFDANLYGTKIGDTFDVKTSRLNIGIANLPDADFTVSVTASYGHIYARDFVTGQKSTTNWSNRSGDVVHPYDESARRFMLGYFAAYQRLGNWENSGAERWTYGHGYKNKTDSATTYGWQGGDNGAIAANSGTAFTIFKGKLATGFYTETIARDETIGASATTAAYHIWHDTTLRRTATYSSDASAKTRAIYLTDETAHGGFYLLSGHPADVVSVAVYNRNLSKEELAQNKVADLVEYYHLDISALLEDGAAAQLADFKAQAANYQIDSANYTANKTRYQAVIDALGKEVVKTTYDELYVSDGLVGLYTMFDVAEAEQVLLTGKWMNKIEDGASATVKGPMYGYDAAISANWGWQVGANGGLHVSYTRPVYGSVVMNKNSNTANFTGIILDAALFAVDAVTVETVMTVEPILNANGTIFETNATTDQYGVYNSYDATFALGNWKTTSFIAKGHGGASFGQDRWRYDHRYWGNHNGNNTGGGGNDGVAHRSFYSMTEIVTYTMRETINRPEGATATSTFQVDWNFGERSLSWTSNGTKFYEPGTGEYKLLNGIGGSIYAVRVYSKNLSVAEQQKNHFIDILAYNGINPAKVKALTPEQVDLGAAYFAKYTVEEQNKAFVSMFVDSLDGTLANESLYVTDGIVGLFTTYGNDISVNTADRTWLNKAGGSTATLAGAWKATEDGGITNGPMYFGRANPKMNYYTGEYIYERDESKSNTWTHLNYLDLGNAHLPKGDMTVEIVSNYHEIGLLTDAGEWVPYRHYTATHWYKKTEGGVTTTVSSVNALTSTDAITYELIGTGYTVARSYISNSQANAIGNIKAFSSVGGNFEECTHYAYRWYASAGAGGWTGSNINHIAEKNTNAWEDKAGYYTSNPGSVQTKTITRKMNEDGSVHIEIGRNFDMTITADPTAAEWAEETANSPFFLFKNEWVDLYSVRIYGKVLSADEQTQNRAADMIHYFGLDLTQYNNYAPETKKSINKALAALSFNVEKATAQAVVDGGAYSSAAYDAAYVQNGLVALFTAFDARETSIDIANGVWANKVANGTDATILGHGYYWHVGNDGGLTSVMTKQEHADVRKNMASRTGIVLDDKYAELPNVTVEALHKVVPVIDATTGENYISSFTASHVDENDVKIPDIGEKYGLYENNRTYIRMGMFNAFTFASPRVNNDNNSLGYNRWFISNAAYGSHGGSKTYTEKDPVTKEDVTKTRDFVEIMDADAHVFNTALKSTTAQYSILTAADGAVTYSVAHNGQVSTTKTLDKATNDALKSATYTDKEGVHPYFDGSAGGQFAFFRGVPVTVYAIRVYNRQLTAAEMTQNHFVDMAAYFGLDLSKLPAEGKEAVYAAFKGVSVETDADYAKSLYGFYTGDKEALAGSLAEFKGYAPLLGKESGYRVLFGINRAAYDLFASGYTVNYGAVVAIGEWGKNTINTLDKLVVTVDANGKVSTSAQNAQVVVVGGTVDGSALYYEDLGDQQIYSVAVTADPAEYGAGVLVRGFYTLTDGAGKTTVHYMDPADDVFEGPVSVMEAADYYVNDFDGNVGLAYKYMNTESLTRVLAACGIAARKGFGGELTIYVDAVNGDDENSGLKADEALKTVAAAVEAAKAHLASETATGVVIDLAAGEYNVDKAIELDGKTFANPNATVTFRGEGEDTVLTGEVSIDLSNIQYSETSSAAYVNLKDTAGNIPSFRYLYSGDALVDVITVGDQENYYDVGTAVVDDTAKTAKIYMNPAFFDEMYDYVGTEVHILIEWNFNIIHVVGVDYNDYNSEGNVAVYVNYNQFKNMAVYNTVNDREYWLANSESVFNYAVMNGAQGYYYNEKTGDLFVTDLESREELSYSVLENMFVLSNIDGLVIEDLAITGVDNKYLTEESGLKGGQAGGSGRTGENGKLEDNGFLTLAAIYGNNIKNARFEGLSIYNVGGDGINLRGIVENVDILSNKIEHVGETAIRVGAAKRGPKTGNNSNKDITIANNFINGTGEFFKQCCGMLITNGANIKIVGNTVINTTYTAISIGWSWTETTMPLADVLNGTTWHLVNVEVAYNYISDFMTCMRDGGAIYILGGNAANSVDKYFNFMHDNYLNVTEETGKHDSRRWFMGYYHDGASSNWYDFNNVIVNNTTTSLDKFVPYYVQGIKDQMSHNVKLHGNYAIGFAGGGALYGETDRINVGRNVIARDYIFSDLAMTKPVVGSQFGNSLSIAAPANAKALVSSIFLSAGSSIDTSVKATGSSAITGGTKNAWDLVLGGGNADLGAITGGLEAPVYQVTVMADGKVYKTYDVASGETFTLPEDVGTPTKARGEHSSFVFTGWNNYTEGMTIVSNITIEAEFEEVIDKHTVTMIVDGENYGELEIPYGEKLSDYLANVETPVKEKTETLVFTFKDWYDADNFDEGFVVSDKVVEGDMTIYGLFSQQARSYQIIIYVLNPETGELDQIGTGSGPYGKDSQFRDGSRFTIYAGEYKDTNKAEYDEFMAQYMPADTDDIKYSYSNKMTLINGNGTLFYANSTGSADYTMWRFRVYEDDTKFQLTFDETYRIVINGEEQWIANGSTIDFAALAGEGYDVTGVTVNGEAVEGTTLAVTSELAGASIEYTTEVKSYTVTFKNADGSIFATETFTHGATLVLPADVPTKESNETHDFVFAGWAEYDYENGMTVTSDLTFTATFDEVEKPTEQYKAGDLNGDGDVNSVDVGWMLQVIAGTRTEDTLCGTAYLNEDSDINSVDVGWLLQIIAGTRDGETLEPIA